MRPAGPSVHLPALALVLHRTDHAHQRVVYGSRQSRLHLKPTYQNGAIIDASSRRSIVFTDQQKMNKVIARLKEEAAKVGANGILIQGTGDEQAGEVSTGAGTATVSGHSAYGTGIGVSAGRIMKTGQGIAIYVPQP